MYRRLLKTVERYFKIDDVDGKMFYNWQKYVPKSENKMAP